MTLLIPLSQPSLAGAARLFCTLVVLALGSASAATYYVAPNGSDSNSGSSSSPFRTIQRAADVVNPGDTVIIRDGTYTGTGEGVVTIRRSGTASQWITFKAENEWGAIIDGRNYQTAHGVLVSRGTGYVRFEGIQIQKTRGGGFSANIDTHDIVYYRNLLHHIGRFCTETSGGLVGFRDKNSSYRMTYDSNVLHTIGRLHPSEGCSYSNGYYKNHDHGMYLWGSDIRIVNNIFYNHPSGWAIQTAQGARDWVIANNTFAFANPNRAGQLLLWDDATNFVIANNIFYEPRTSGVEVFPCGGKSNIIVRNNISTGEMVWDEGSGRLGCSNLTLINNDDFTDPGMVNPQQLDFRLDSSSPAIDRADASVSPSVDYDGNPRPQGGGYDIGAFEFGSSSTISQCDLNTDSLINVADVQSMINLVLGTASGPPGMGDLNQDGSTNVVDVQALVNTVIGISACPI